MLIALLLVLPTLTLAHIQVELKGTVRSNVVSSEAYPRGFEEHVVTEIERATFGIQNEHLKEIIEKINGKKPDEVYTTNVTPFGDLHKRYGWKQVNVKIQALSNNYFVDYSSETVVLSKTKYENANSKAKDTLINENGHLTNTIHSYWTREAKIKNSKTKVTFNFNIDDNSVYFEKTFNFGLNRRYQEKRYYESNATIRLEPRQKVTAELEALKGTIKVEIPYEIFLSGDMIARYNEMYKDKYFFKFDINEVLKAQNITATRIVYQTLIYEVLYDTQLRVRDTEGSVLKSFAAEGKVSKGLKKATNKHYNQAEGVKMATKKIEFNVPVDLGPDEVFDGDNEEESEENEETQETPQKGGKKEEENEKI